MINIHARVKHLIQKYGTRDPNKIADYLGINVEYKHYSNSTKGYFIKILTNKFIIINSSIPNHEKEIVLAHELGHAVLHHNKDIKFIREFTLFPTGRYENEANKFAAELLINENIDKCYIENMSIDQLASYFCVPKELVKYKFNKFF
ncbi:ImmA/IrrE family metallo-endopeptidase [Clostridium cochlearium]|uniref:Putative Zn peptidase n=1 Tax=Clostridium cochlearium TaxID=1494 RepID=A0A2X2VYE3_CLOCO|nr:ImmA/IrrE family metallo-endopeptidase [Clostridium cochlearium]SQB33434.1 putative Zn peptidase [Clostridium cochlearium]